MLVHCSYQTIAPFVSHRIWNHLLRKGFFFFFFFLLSKKNKKTKKKRKNPALHKQDPAVLYEKKIFFSICFCARCQKGKGESVFHVASKVCVCFKLQPSQQTWVSGVSFPKQVPSPSPPSPLSFYTHIFSLSFFPPFGFGSPGCRRGEHTGWKNRPATLKESACLWREDSAEV